MFRHVLQFILLGFTLSILGCGGGDGAGGSSDRPSESEGQQVVSQAIEKNGGGIIKLAGFKKTDGKSIDLTKEYVMSFDVEIEFVADAALSAQGLRADNFYRESGKHTGKAGTKQTFPGWVRFSKSESGWRSQPDKVWLKND